MNEISIRYNRYSYLIPIPFVWLLLGGCWWAVFVDEGEEVGMQFKVLVALLCVGGVFVTYQFIKNFLNPPVIMLINEEGFEYNPANASTGFIKWSEVDKIEDLAVMTTNASNAGKFESALGVWLKNPDSYFQKKNFALQRLMKLSQRMYGATILIQPASIGKRYPEVRTALLNIAAQTVRTTKAEV